MKHPSVDQWDSGMTSLTMQEAVLILYKGQSNVKIMADRVGVPLDVMQAELRAYVAATPLDEDVWRGDVELAFPYIT